MEQEAHATSRCEAIILTALPVEFEAVCHFLEEQPEVEHPQGNIYCMGTFPCIKGKIQVAVSQIGGGGIAAAWEVERALNFFRAGTVLFVGIAGGLKDVCPGDVVVASKVYNYETGKAAQSFEPRPELEHSSNKLEWRARAEARKNEWLARLEGPCPNPAPQVHIGPLAAGEKELSSRESPLAHLLKQSYGNALAVEMEGYGFLQAVRQHHGIDGLVVRGIASLIDEKAETLEMRQRAARHAAAFAFQVLAKFVFPFSIDFSSTSPKQNAAIWYVPHKRNPYFTGREAILEDLKQMLAPDGEKTATVQVISGLGGIGKTRLAIEYAYQCADVYDAILWVQADSQELLMTNYVLLATQGLGLPEQKEAQEQVVEVKRWLETHHHWLLIFDNVEQPQEVIAHFLPSKYHGSVLMTTRQRDARPLAQCRKLPEFSEEEAVRFLLQRAGLGETVEQVSATDRSLAQVLCEQMGRLPLALDQAGAYIVENGSSLQRYFDLYQQSRLRLLDRRATFDDHPDSVQKTFWLSWEAIQRRNPLAGKALQFAAFLAPDQIHEELVQEGLGEDAEKPNWELEIDEALGLLYRYSLIERIEQVFSVHRLVQEVIQGELAKKEQRFWMERAVEVVDMFFPSGEYGTWSTCEVLLPHALVCMEWIENIKQKQIEGGRLLQKAGRYLYERAQYEKAEPLLQRALAIREKQLGAEHPNTVANMNDLGLLYQAQGRYEEAEPLYKRALAIRKKQLGAEHPDIVVAIMNNLAALYRAQGRYEEAELLYKRVLQAAEKQLGAEHPNIVVAIMNNLAALYQDQGRYEEAEPLYKRALTIAEQRLGAEHPNTANSMNSLGMLYQAQGRYEEAEPLLRRAVQITAELLGLEHDRTQKMMINYWLFCLRFIPGGDMEVLLQRMQGKDDDEGVEG